MVVAAVVERARDVVARPKGESRWFEKVLLKPYGLIYGFMALTPSLPQYPIRRPKANLKARMGLQLYGRVIRAAGSEGNG